jgi:hypothetical protein
VYAETNYHNVKVSSKQVEFGPAVIQIDYGVDFEVYRPSIVKPGESFTITFQPKSGTITYHVSALGKTYSVNQNLPLGSQINFQVVPTIDAFVSNFATSDIQIDGPVSNSYQKATWRNNNSQQFSVYVNNDLRGQNQIVIRAPIQIQIDTGLEFDAIIIQHELGRKNIGILSAYPVIVETIPIDVPMSGFSSFNIGITEIFLVIIAIIIIIIIVLVAVRMSRRKKYTPLKTELKSSIPDPPIYEQESQQQITPEKNDDQSDSIYKETIIGPKSYTAFPIEIKNGGKIIGKIASHGNFEVFITDREHFKKFQEKKKRYFMEFYEQGKSSKYFSHEFSFIAPHEGEYLFVILNDSKSTLNVKFDYFLR